MLSLPLTRQMWNALSIKTNASFAARSFKIVIGRLLLWGVDAFVFRFVAFHACAVFVAATVVVDFDVVFVVITIAAVVRAAFTGGTCVRHHFGTGGCHGGRFYFGSRRQEFPLFLATLQSLLLIFSVVDAQEEHSHNSTIE